MRIQEEKNVEKNRKVQNLHRKKQLDPDLLLVYPIFTTVRQLLRVFVMFSPKYYVLPVFIENNKCSTSII